MIALLRRHRRHLGAVAALFLFIAWSLPVSADFTGPCAETAGKYCSDVIPGDGRVMKCLDSHADAQSPACKDWIAEQRKGLQELNSACREEIAVLCRYDASNTIRVFQCLNDNYVGLKLDCRNKMRELKERFQ